MLAALVLTFAVTIRRRRLAWAMYRRSSSPRGRADSRTGSPGLLVVWVLAMASREHPGRRGPQGPSRQGPRSGGGAGALRHARSGVLRCGTGHARTRRRLGVGRRIRRAKRLTVEPLARGGDD